MRILVTAGPTREPIDAVRFIGNRSSGRMGYAVAARAAARGHEVILVSGPVALATPAGVTRVGVETAADMLAAVRERIPWCEALVMAAAVVDWRPARPARGKLKKAAGAAALALEPTADVLREIAPLKGSRVFVGFAAETADLLPEARRKRADKGLDLIVANDVSQPDAGFDVETNRVTFVAADREEALPLLPKTEVADRILDWVERRAGAR